MDEKLVQSIIANLSESLTRKNQALEIDLAVARAERDQALAKIAEFESASNSNEPTE